MPNCGPVLMALILNSPVCLSCIAATASLSADAAQAALTLVERAIHIHHGWWPCQRCGVPRTVYWLEGAELLRPG